MNIKSIKLLLIPFCLLTFCCHAESLKNTSYEKLESKITNDDYKKITSVLVNHKGNRVYENYFNDGSSDHKNDIRSASKSITALLFGMAIEDGYFDSEQDLVLPAFKDKYPIVHLTKKKKEMTFEDLLMMNPPMECNDWNDLSQGNEERMYILEDWERFVLDLPNRGIPPWEPKAEDRPFGVAFSYCTAGVFLTGSAIARKTKVGLDKYAYKKLFKPLQIKDIDWVYSPLGIAQGGGGLKIKSKDLMKIGELVLNNGVFDGKQIVNSDWSSKMLKARAMAMPQQNIKYGYLWWIFEFEHKGKTITAYAAAGNGGNYLWVVPELELVSVITSTAFNTRYMHQQTQEIFESIILKSI